MQIPVFKCRASAIGRIMVNPKEKSNLDKYIDAVASVASLTKRLSEFKDQSCKTANEIREKKLPEAIVKRDELEKIKDVKKLSESAKTYLREWIINKKYGRKKEVYGKQLDKGNYTEQDGFEVVQTVLFPGVFLPKNYEEFEDDYFTGVPDVTVHLIDNKSSWDIFSFPSGEDEISNANNEYQMRGYMRLVDRGTSKLCYTLNDTPPHLVEDELWRYKRHNNLIDIPDSEAYGVIKNHVYTRAGLDACSYLFSNTTDTSDFIEIPIEKRLIAFTVDRDWDIEAAMIERVLECRQWVNENYHRF
jgi:hypothetical protein